MELLPVDSAERLAKAKKVWDQIAEKHLEIQNYLRGLDAELLEKDNADAHSDLSDPFSDMGDSEFAKPACKKVREKWRLFRCQFRLKRNLPILQRMSKLESDTLLMSSFTPEFMRVQEEMLKSVEGGPQRIYKEDLGTRSYDYLVDMPHESDEKLKEMVENMLSNCRLPSPPPEVEEDPSKPRGTLSPENKIMGKSPLGDFNETNSLSEVWRLLEAQSTSNGFPVSPMGYNVFDDKRMGWLRRETGTWGEQEASRKKCEEWLKNL